ncbi:MAG: malonyl-ACP O-methyltransferase BioC [Pseudomonadota bacterium]|nr:malonyl-ACP O-methyltransferase BioC [Pseudomonadota bacterium]
MSGDRGSGRPDELDIAAVRRAFGRAARTYDSVAVLQREVGSRMAQRLDLVKITPEAILDAGCGTGDALPELGGRYPLSRRIAADIAVPMLEVARERHAPSASAFARLQSMWRRSAQGPLAFVAADVTRLPFAYGTFDLVWSNLALQWVNDLPLAFAELHRVLRVGGLAMITTLGPDTLQEVRKAFRSVDDAPHVSRFADMHDIGDMLVEARFADPVMHMERLTLTYSDPRALLRDLKLLGATNATHARGRGLFGRERWQRALAALDGMRVEGQIPATFEVVYGHAWKTEPTRTTEGLGIIRFAPRA